jgi:large subunit ribosomal protein L2
MGKSIISQARGRGGPRYQVRKSAFIYRVKYPIGLGEAEIIKLIHSPAHSAPIAKIKIGSEIFFNAAFDGAFEGKKINIGSDAAEGNIAFLKDIPVGTKIFNVEINPGDGGKMVRSAGSSAIVHKRYDHNKIGIIMRSRKEIVLNGACRASIGIVAGGGHKLKPFIRAGAVFYKKRAKGGRVWPRTSAVKMNAVDHPFGSGRGKRIKSKIAKRNAPAGARVGHIRPRRTGRVK